jgi:hypothetical protein
VKKRMMHTKKTGLGLPLGRMLFVCIYRQTCHMKHFQHWWVMRWLHVWGETWWKKGTNVNPNQCHVLSKCMHLSELLCFYTHNIGECHEQNVLNLELALFHLKHKVSIKQLLTEFFIKKVIWTQEF